MEAPQNPETPFGQDWKKVREATGENLEILEQCLDTVMEWEAGRVPLQTTYSMCTPRDGWIAINHTAVGTEERAMLMRLFDARLAADPNLVESDQNWTFETEECEREGILFRRGAGERGKDAVYIPIQAVWRLPPTRTSPGIPGEHIYRRE